MSDDDSQSGFFGELKRRNVVKVAIAYGVTGWILVEVAAVILPIFESPEWILQVFALIVILGFPLALIFAWAFEVTPEGLKRTREVPLHESTTAQTGRKLDFIIIGVLTILLALSVSIHFLNPPFPGGNDDSPDQRFKRSIAVVPFENLSPDSDQEENEYLVDGVTDSIITALSRFPDLRVTARNSSFTYKGRLISVKEIGSQLNVRYILVGSVMKVGDTIRSSIQLVETTTGKELWADKFDRDFVSRDDVLNVIDDVTKAIVTAIMSPDSGPFAQAERTRVLARNQKTLDAYEYFLRGKQQFYQYNSKANVAARQYFEKSIELDPGFAKAHANLAWTHAQDFDFQWSEDPDYSLRKAFEYAQIAYDLDDADYESLWALGWAYLNYQGKHDIAMRYYERALELNSNDAEMIAEMGNILIYTGQPERAIEQILKAIERNPFRDQWYDEYLGWAYDEAGQFDRAIEILSVIDTHEGWWGHAYLACSYADVGNMRNAREEVRNIRSLNPDFTWKFYLDWVDNKRRYMVSAQRDRRIDCLANAMEKAGA